MAGHVAHRFHQAARSAAIDVALGILQHRPQIERLAEIAIVMMDHHLAAKFRRGRVRRENAVFSGERVQ